MCFSGKRRWTCSDRMMSINFQQLLIGHCIVHHQFTTFNPPHTAVLWKNPVLSFRRCQISFTKNEFAGRIVNIFCSIFCTILFAIWSKISEIFDEKYEYLSSKIHFSSKQTWQLVTTTHAHTAFIRSGSIPLCPPTSEWLEIINCSSKLLSLH